MKSHVLFAVVCAAATAGVAHGQITVYNTQAAFNAATTSQGVDTFDDLAPVLMSSPTNRNAGAYTYTAAAASGLYGAGSGGDGWLSNNTSTDTLTFNSFSAGVYAAGGFFFTSNISGLYSLGDINVTATDASGSVTQLIVNSQTTSFLGFSSPSGITSITLQAVQPSDGGFIWVTANDFTLAVPTPGAAAVLGLGAVAGLRRRR